MMRLIVLLVAGLLAVAGVAEQVTPGALRLLVEYPGNGEVTLVWKNLTQAPLTLEYNGLPITRVTTVDGADVPMTAIIDAMLFRATVPPGGEQRSPIHPARFYDLIPGEAYLITVACQVLQADSGFGYTFPYVMPAQQYPFGSGWTPVEGRRGVEARLVVSLIPAERRSEVRVEFRNMGEMKEQVFDWAMLTAELRRAGDGTPLKHTQMFWEKTFAPRRICLPRYASLSLAVYQYQLGANPQALPAGWASIWLGNRQYLLQQGERYRIDAVTSLPGVDRKPVDVKLRPCEVYWPAPAALPAEKSPVTASFQYLDNGEVKVIFTNTLDHTLKITRDVISAVDRSGNAPQSTTSSQPPGLWARTAVPAHGEASFTFEPYQFMLTAGEWYLMTGSWMLRDEGAKRNYAVFATFPHVAPMHGLPFAGAWQPVAGRPGLEVCLSGQLSTPRTPLLGRAWQPTTWVMYRNTGKDAVPVFDFPTLDVKVQTSAGIEVPGRHFTQTGIPNIETLSLPPGATLTLPASTHALPIDFKSLPENMRYTLCFENVFFPLSADDRYRVEGTVLLPDGEKTVEVSFGSVEINLY